MPSMWLLYLRIRQMSERIVVLLRQLRHLPRTPLPRPVVLSVFNDSPLTREHPQTVAKSKSRLAARWASSRLRASYTLQHRLISCSLIERSGSSSASCARFAFSKSIWRRVRAWCPSSPPVVTNKGREICTGLSGSAGLLWSTTAVIKP